METTADLKTILEHAVPRPQSIELDAEHHAVILPSDWRVQDISEMLPDPPRIQQTVTLLTVDAFTGYVDEFKLPHSTVFADEKSANYEAVLDYHASEGRRGTSQHVARYACPQSDEWQLWNAQNRKPMSQADFARFLEDNLPDVTNPPAASFLELILNLQIHKTANFVSDTKLSNGQTVLRYEETIRNESKQGDLQFPDSFVIGVPVFVDGARYAMKCRLRYRLEESKLRLWYELERPAEVFRAAVKTVSEQILKALPDVSFWAGKRA